MNKFVPSLSLSHFFHPSVGDEKIFFTKICFPHLNIIFSLPELPSQLEQPVREVEWEILMSRTGSLA